MDGSMFVDEVGAGDLWLFLQGRPHSIQSVGEDGCEFLPVFNQANFSEETMFLLSDWLKHTPELVLQKDFGLSTESLAKLPKGDPLYIFPSEEPTQTVAQDRAEAEGDGQAEDQLHIQGRHDDADQEHCAWQCEDRRRNEFPASPKICAGIVTGEAGWVA